MKMVRERAQLTTRIDGMPTYTYSALDNDGKQNAGSLAAESRAAAMDRLTAQKLFPVSIEESAGTSQGGRITFRSARVSRTSVDAFFRELANLLGAGVPLSRALTLLKREASQPAARAQWTEIHDDVVGGMSLADALARWPKTFPQVHVAMVRAGEAGGFLDLVLSQIADFRFQEQELKGKVKAALIYPIILASLAGLVLVFLLTSFIPKFTSLFAEFGGTLPWLTQVIVAASELILKYGPLLLLAGMFGLVFVRRAAFTESGRRGLERLVLALPVLGSVASQFALVRFCRMLGTLIGAGVPLIAALKVARESIGNQTLADAVSQSIEDVQNGSPLSLSLSGCRELFPPSIIEMISVAEESGRLDKELVRQAITSESELERHLRMAVALLEPLLLFVMAAFIGTVVIGMLLPIFNLQEMIR